VNFVKETFNKTVILSESLIGEVKCASVIAVWGESVLIRANGSQLQFYLRLATQLPRPRIHSGAMD
jgi:hypothetical protein